MGYRPPKDDDEDDKPAAPPVEPNGHDLTEQRKRQADGKTWSAKMWDEIAHGLHTEQRKQKYVTEPKGRKRRANGN